MQIDADIVFTKVARKKKSVSLEVFTDQLLPIVADRRKVPIAAADHSLMRQSGRFLCLKSFLLYNIAREESKTPQPPLPKVTCSTE